MTFSSFGSPVGDYACHPLASVLTSILCDRPGDQSRHTFRRPDWLRLLRIDLGQPVRSELRDVKKDMFARVHAHSPGMKIVLVELLAELHRVQTGEGTGIIQRVVIVQGEIVLLLLMD